MAARRTLIVYKVCTAAAAFALLSTATFAQQVDEDAGAPVGQVQDLPELDLELSREAIEEIIVVAPKPGGRRRLDPVYEDPMRARLLQELYKMEQIEEESAWRQASIDNSSSRIKWGYNPADDYRIHSEMDILVTPSDKVQPSSLFRVEF
jgi:hypothetical protein